MKFWFTISFIIASTFVGPATADYTVRDGNGVPINIKTLQPTPGTFLPQSTPSDQNGLPYSGSNPLPVQQGNFGGAGSDASMNAPSLSGLTLLATMAANGSRTSFEVGVNCTAGLTVVLDDQAGSLTPTIIPLMGPTVNGGQGGSYSSRYHTGRVRFYSSSSGCQYWARQWP